jgi:hypothetical protein
MSDRRYTDEEVREILARATAVPSVPAAASETGPDEPGALVAMSSAGASVPEGLTLVQLQDIAAEAGIAPDRIASAARSLEVRPRIGQDEDPYLGVVVDVSHVVALPRMMSDDEWDRFVVRLRDTFDDPGQVRKEGSLRTWTHGTLKVLLEPLAQGARLRFEDRQDSAKGSVDGGVAMAVSGATGGGLLGGLAALGAASFEPALIAMMGGLSVLGAAIYGFGWWQAKQWRPQRRSEFAVLGSHVLAELDAASRRIPPGSA